MDDNAETIAEIVAELAQYEESGERPCKEEVWRLGARIAEAARVAVAAEREACAATALEVPDLCRFCGGKIPRGYDPCPQRKDDPDGNVCAPVYTAEEAALVAAASILARSGQE